MVLPRPPGVYFQRADSPEWVVEEARSDVAGFVGITERGPLHTPVCVQSETQFWTRFGRSGLDYAYLPDAVHGFFANGGRMAWIVRVGKPIDPLRHAMIHLTDQNHRPVFRVWARDPGWGGGTISVRVQPQGRSRFQLTIGVLNTAGREEIIEVWRDLEPNRYLSDPTRDNERYAAKVVNGWATVLPPFDRHPSRSVVRGSALVSLEALVELEAKDRIVGVQSVESHYDSSSPRVPDVRLEGRLGWSNDFVPVKQRSVLRGMKLDHFLGGAGADQNWGLSSLEAIPEVSIVAIPDLVWENSSARYQPAPRQPCSPASVTAEVIVPNEERTEFTEKECQTAHLAMLSHCARLRNRFAVLDPPQKRDASGVREYAQQLQSESGQFGGLYFPWIGVSTAQPGVRWMPPSGHLAGIYARVDLSRGVQKSPANEVLSEVQGVMQEITEDTHGLLNSDGVNVLVATRARGIRVMGARTLVSPSSSEHAQWQFISVRRLLLMLEKSLEGSAFWLVHGGNDHRQWADVERVVRNFLLRQWQQGRLGGTTPEAAFSVECDENTNPREDREAGKLTCQIGVQPPLPAEFVIVRLGELGGGAGTWNSGENRNGNR